VKELRSQVLTLAIALVALAGYLPFAPVRLYDFRAFYCAGKAVVAQADPYREHPLHECEREHSAPGMAVDADDVTVPAPLPGYVLAIFALLSRFPFAFCALMWVLASITAVVVSIELLRRVIGLPPATIAVIILLPAAIVAIPLGQPAPFVGCAIALCAYGLTFRRWRLAAAGALATSFDPAIALVLCATLVLSVPRTRLPIVLGSFALVAISLVTLGIDTNIEYIRGVLHAHAAGNVAERSQFSTSHFAWVAGLGISGSLLLGNLWFGCFGFAGIWIARRLRPRFGIAALALAPPAFAVFGGLYVHFSQLVLALPAYLMVLRQLSQKQAWMLSAIFVLAVPWLALAAFPPFAIALVALAIAYAGKIGGKVPTVAAFVVCLGGLAWTSVRAEEALVSALQ
jgi:hypothetical protein